MGAEWSSLALWSVGVHASSLHFKEVLLALLLHSSHFHTDMLPFWIPGLRNSVDSMMYVSRARALVSPLVAGKFWGYREMHWVWVFSSVIPPLDGDAGQSVVNIYIYAFMDFQVGCIRIRSLNTSQSDEMVERNKATFPRMEEYIFIFIFTFVQVVSWWWCCFSACYQCEHPGAFSCDICEPQIQSCHLNSVRLQGGVSQSFSGGGETD